MRGYLLLLFLCMASLAAALVVKGQHCQNNPDPSAFLGPCAAIDCCHPSIESKARELKLGAADQTSATSIAKRCFEFVRDEIRHSWDFQANPVTFKASDVLEHATGYCYSKSHLLVALLRANGIPAGLSYQRLTVSDDGAGPPHCLHGLVAVHLPDFGWYRIDPRGLKPGALKADFCPPREALAFPIQSPGECDVPGILVEPMPIIAETLTKFNTFQQVADNLPDYEPSTGDNF